MPSEPSDVKYNAIQRLTILINILERPCVFAKFWPGNKLILGAIFDFIIE